ncbi:hypothetical protein GCM10007094_36130 [Pseudovibrio japonicus]|uniref:Uncharacterized protein n=1 Tax=Pseudovibrio japonicus TaxID=366534 RepID=A0ABQ3ENQ6_9HYPH|nr:hypothetical protein [Pseudovibrio japonicus]GHB43479.1 hypothetical protein GCM10007094_36130 [Pseudovibrio japonicus]
MQLKDAVTVDFRNKYHLLAINNILIPWAYDYLIGLVRNILIALPIQSSPDFSVLSIAVFLLMNLYNLYLIRSFKGRELGMGIVLVVLNVISLIFLASVSFFTAIPTIPLVLGTMF